MPRRIKCCENCNKRFVTTSQGGLCPVCRQPKSSKESPAFELRQDESIIQNVASRHEVPAQLSSEKLDGAIDNDDGVADDAAYENGSEGGDDIFCTQIEDDEIVSSDDEDEGLALSALVTKKRLSLDVVPVVSSEEKAPADVAVDRSAAPFTGESAHSGGEIIVLDGSSPGTDNVKADLAVGGAQFNGGYAHLPTETTVAEKEIVLKGSTNRPENVALDVCSVCGASLALQTWRARVNHLKRCSKQHGHTSDDIRLRIEEEATYNVKETYEREESRSPQNSIHNAHRPPAPTEKPARVSSVSVMDVLMQGARRLAKSGKAKRQGGAVGKQSASASRKRPHQQPYNQPRDPSSIRPCPFYKKITGTDFVVDGFQFAKPGLTDRYFLTHFHSDHYGGIRKNWNYGTIYCSEPTANLVNTQLGVDRQYLHVLPMNEPTTIETRGSPKVTVTLIDANHCPGAVMLLFKVRNRNSTRNILHVGDFRWHRQRMTPHLSGFCSGALKLDELYFDTTYCNPKYSLPSQQDAIQATVEFAERTVNQARNRKQKLLVLFGAYTIGKERIYLAVARRLGMKVYVDRRRYRILSQFGWSKERMSLLTTEPEQSILWVVPLGHVSMKNLPNYLTVEIGKSFSRTFDRVVGFRPTGWSMTTRQTAIGGGKGGLLKPATRGNVTSVGVPYSEHSSFPELVDCLRQLKPQKIIPTVSVSKAKEQVDLLLSHLQ
mmetsp:Transcript_25454/g.70296  ORF Transcript_25454/g.70296 Transcript_25454/m.70296 type:complete len:717 (+) Transcript_25454:61-2211(+)